MKPHTLSFARYSIETDEAGRQFILQWRGPRPLLATRVAITLVLIPFVFAGLLPFLPFVEAEGGEMPVPVIIAFLFVPLLGAFLVGQRVGYWRRLVWDRDRDCFQARWAGWFLWGWRTLTIPIAQMERIEIEAGVVRSLAEIGTPEFQLRIDHSTPAGRIRMRCFELLIQYTPTVAEARELAYRIAKASRFSNFQVQDHGGSMTWELSRPDEAEQLVDANFAAKPIADLATAAATVSRTQMHQAGDAVAPFDAEAIEEEILPARITEWLPKSQVAIQVPAAKPGCGYLVPLFLLACFLSGVGWLIGVMSGGFLRNWVSSNQALWLLYATAILAASGGFWLLTFYRFPDREVLFDWGRGVVACRHGLRGCEYPLDEVRALVLCTPGSGGEATSYRCYLEMEWPEGAVELIRTSVTWDKPDAACKALLPCAAELARALDVPLRRGAQPAARPGYAIRTAGWLLVLLLPAVAGGLTWSTSILEEQHSACNSIAQRGGECELRSARDYGHFQARQRHWYVSFPGGKATDQMLHELKPSLATLVDVALDLSGSPISNNSLASLAGLDNLRVLILAQTPLTDDGLHHLSQAYQLEVLDLSQTAVSNAGLVHLERLNLKVLILRDTSVTPAGLTRLRERLRSNVRVVSAVAEIDEEARQLAERFRQAMIAKDTDALLAMLHTPAYQHAAGRSTVLTTDRELHQAIRDWLPRETVAADARFQVDYILSRDDYLKEYESKLPPDDCQRLRQALQPDDRLLFIRVLSAKGQTLDRIGIMVGRRDAQPRVVGLWWDLWDD